MRIFSQKRENKPFIVEPWEENVEKSVQGRQDIRWK